VLAQSQACSGCLPEIVVTATRLPSSSFDNWQSFATTWWPGYSFGTCIYQSFAGGGCGAGRWALASLAVVPLAVGKLGAIAAEATTTSVFWSGPGTQAAAESWAAANGGSTLSVAAGATPAEVTAASANFAASASGNVVVFQNAAQGVAVGGTWAQTEFGALMANPSVTGITYNLIDNTGATICTIVCPK